MQSSEVHTESYKIYKYQLKQPQSETEIKSVLIVEDDLALRPLWERIFLTMNRAIKIDWVTAAEEAELLIRFRYKSGQPYNLVIADIALEGKSTGIDLWNKYGEEVANFAFVSGLPMSKYDFHSALNHGLPPYYQKPVNAKVCLEIAELLNSHKKQ